MKFRIKTSDLLSIVAIVFIIGMMLAIYMGTDRTSEFAERTYFMVCALWLLQIVNYLYGKIKDAVREEKKSEKNKIVAISGHDNADVDSGSDRGSSNT